MELSKEALDIIYQAMEYAKKRNYEYVTPELVLLMMLRDKTFTEAFEECGIDTSFYANRRFEYDEILPWDHLDYLVSKEFLIRENKTAHQSKTTPNCRLRCSGCGVNKKVGRECF